MNKIINPERNYSFSDFFDLEINPKVLSKEFGYSFERNWLNLPQYPDPLDRCQDTISRIKEVYPYVDLSTAKARRNWLISPTLMDLIHYTKVEIIVEYQIKVDQYLQGVIDYLLESSHQMIIVEAKKANLDCAMTQLISELIALDRWLEEERQPEILGAVTTGKSWEFARLDRTKKHIEQGLKTYSIPNEFEILMRIFVQALI